MGLTSEGTCWKAALRQANHAAARDFVVSFQDDFDRFGVNAVLLGEDPIGKRVLVVRIEDGYRGLQNDRPGIQIFIHKVDRTTGELHSVIERLPLRFESGKRWQKGRMNVQNTLRKC